MSSEKDLFKWEKKSESSELYVNMSGQLCKMIQKMEYEIKGVNEQGNWILKIVNKK